MDWTRSFRCFFVVALTAACPWIAPSSAQVTTLDPIVYTIRVPAPETHVAEIEARVPTDKRASIELLMPNWSPGYYALGDYTRDVSEFAASALDGTALEVQKPKGNHWLVSTHGSEAVKISYKLHCTSQFVTGSWVGSEFAVINGPSTFLELIERPDTGVGAELPSQSTRPYEMRLELPPSWKQSITSLDAAPDRQPNHFRGPSYDVFIDSPIVAGTISVHEFVVGSSKHVLADFGDLGAWDGKLAAEKLARIAAEHRRMLGELPFQRYVFLNAFRRGAGGLEHLNSSLLSSSPGPKEPQPTLRWLEYVSHEYFHAINVKRLRPIELGPFDYEKLPSTSSLWISEGLTSYYGDLAVVRSGVGAPEDFLSGMSGYIRTVQTSPGRLVQTLEQASLTAGVTSSSGVGGDRNATISYYEKGPVVGWLLDARIRRVTNDAKSLDDVMRLANKRYSGARGFTAAEFQATVSEVAGSDLAGLLHQCLATTEELDYSEALAWFGLRFSESGAADSKKAWTLEAAPDATDSQKLHWKSLVTSRER